ncbi:hypothetical protein ADP8_05204 (plasmid) [Roseomonas mucosa]|nr:hypothetical protein ADP8_05204 [Roseomonas mucosa]
MPARTLLTVLGKLIESIFGCVTRVRGTTRPASVGYELASPRYESAVGNRYRIGPHQSVTRVRISDP